MLPSPAHIVGGAVVLIVYHQFHSQAQAKAQDRAFQTVLLFPYKAVK